MQITNVAELKTFFDDYVFGYMCKDIQRELDLASSGKNAGNFLSALGLLCYTEFMGGIMRGTHKPGNSGKNFNAFLNLMGAEYVKFTQTCDVYKVFRCGLVHEYFSKQTCTIIMLNSSQKEIVIQGNQQPASWMIPDETIELPVNVGIGQATNGNHYFIVEKYLEDFQKACRKLLSEFEGGQRSVTAQPFQLHWPEL